MSEPDTALREESVQRRAARCGFGGCGEQMLGGAREFRYDWILLRARDLPREAGGTPAPIILRGGSRRISPSFSGGRHVTPGSQSKLVTTVWASKDANFGIATSDWYDSH
jgi:hypothetical protein